MRMWRSGGGSESTVRWFDVGNASVVRLSPADLYVGMPTYFLVEACNHALRCAQSNVSRGVQLVEMEPSGGSVQVKSSPNATLGFVNDPFVLFGGWDNFTASGCPVHCGDRPCYYDAVCSDPSGNSLGCNASGVGLNCRLCGFGGFFACPSTSVGEAVATVYSAQGSHENATSVLSMRACLGTTQYGCAACAPHRPIPSAHPIPIPSPPHPAPTHPTVLHRSPLHPPHPIPSI